jgi:hypothetical protein
VLNQIAHSGAIASARGSPKHCKARTWSIK